MPCLVAAALRVAKAFKNFNHSFVNEPHAAKSTIMKTYFSVVSVRFLTALLILSAGMGNAGQMRIGPDPMGASLTAPSLNWSIVPSPRKPGTSSHLYGVSVLSATEAWAVGDRQESEGSPLIYRWNGTRWREVAAAPIADSYLQDVVAISANDVWAVGHQDRDDFSPDLSLTQHWNGVAWSIVPVLIRAGIPFMARIISAR